MAPIGTLPAKLQSAAVRIFVHPVNLLSARQISAAFHDAKRTDPANGRPTEHAREQYRWLMEEPESKYASHIETWEDDDGQIHASVPFAWYCMANGYDIQLVRREGLPIGVYGWKETTGGIRGIFTAWQIAREKWEEKQNADQTTENSPVCSSI